MFSGKGSSQESFLIHTLSKKIRFSNDWAYGTQRIIQSCNCGQDIPLSDYFFSAKLFGSIPLARTLVASKYFTQYLQQFVLAV